MALVVPLGRPEQTASSKGGSRRLGLLEIRGEIIPERLKRQSQNKNSTQLWM